ncbi:hypothetical protein XALC_0339 [Xanthomonas albilineans GPE PC73]|uniref:Uncharacterized protein n=1 Tax=Xanthomonas albilineans (strain GPE PC73 / CFBP 7063) TaxID=380358 RepID=D2UBC3_XANAP|nr:hypothetical protein XALC_0339 [Xanthomonas albilineans GPE PC73]
MGRPLRWMSSQFPSTANRGCRCRSRSERRLQPGLEHDESVGIEADAADGCELHPVVWRFKHKLLQAMSEREAGRQLPPDMQSRAAG